MTLVSDGERSEIQESLKGLLEKNVLFELNDQATRDQFLDAAYSYLNADIRVMKFAVRCNEDNNPPEAVAERSCQADFPRAPSV